MKCKKCGNKVLSNEEREYLLKMIKLFDRCLDVWGEKDKRINDNLIKKLEDEG